MIVKYYLSFRIIILYKITTMSTTSKITPRKRLKPNKKACSEDKDNMDVDSVCAKHNFSLKEKKQLQLELLKWYDKHQRDLPWRTIARTEKDADVRGYAVWVSEVMLQQTQVATVKPYYLRWMEKWPTVTALAKASLEEVNKVWAGLGYYSRAKRLHEGANIISKEMRNGMPQTAVELKDKIPGIGKYTASAIASVAFQEPVGVVDGNVMRVLSRIRAIGSDISKPITTNHFWQLADEIVSKERPGDFNQALMEFGATVCSPRNPSCNVCPLIKMCEGYKMTNAVSDVQSKKMKKSKASSNLDTGVQDIEEYSSVSCYLCLSKEAWKTGPDVMAFPFKPKKKSSRIERVAVVVVEQNGQLLMSQRPETGLLAGLWEFPSIILDETASNDSEHINSVLEDIGILPSVSVLRNKVGDVVHLFSHIHTTYEVEHLLVEDGSVILKPKQDKPMRWLTREDIMTAAVSTAMKKIIKIVDKNQNNKGTQKSESKKKKQKLCPSDNKKQQSIKNYFN